MTPILKNKLNEIITYTNYRLNNWYKNIKEEYNIEGKGFARFDSNKNAIVIEFTENGENFIYEEFCWMYESIEYTFDVWMEFGAVE